jgi:release factor glutamine methyltransferase
MTLIYEPAEDSYLLSEILQKEVPRLLNKNPELKVLEIGVGSGIQLKTLKKLRAKNIFGSDINPDSVKYCKSLGFNCIYSDLFSNIKEKYDIILFNPPYLPKVSEKLEDKESELITTGGKKGSEIINKFLVQTKDYLNESGKIFLLTSSLTTRISWSNYKKKLLAEKNIFFEKLFVWELEPDKNNI